MIAFIPIRLCILATLLQVTGGVDADVDGVHVAYYRLQDANYNVMGLFAGANHPDGAGGTLPDGSIRAQYTYTPYGELVASESFAPHAINRVGHQGLFFDRFDGTASTPVLEPGAKGLYYNRNRSYSPTLGRFMQRDPNETAIPIIVRLAVSSKVPSELI
jgi:RHS repeat-associated protein